MAPCGVYSKCSGVALDLLQSGSRVAPEIKFMFIYGTMWGIRQGFIVVPEKKFVFMCGIMWGMTSAQEWLQSCFINQVYVHIWHYVGYMASALEWLQI